MTNDFFILLRAGLWQKAATDTGGFAEAAGNDAALKGAVLSSAPDWEGIYTLANEQAVTGIVTDGIVVMGLEKAVPQAIGDKFIADASYITSTNLKTNAVQMRLCRMLEDAGLSYVILKGQEAARNYPKPLLRVSGDIDILLPPEQYGKAKELLHNIGVNPTDKPLAGEYSIYVDGIQVELHNNIYAGINPRCAKGFDALAQSVFSGRKRAGADVEATLTPGADAPFVPSDDFNAIYLLVHAARHLGSFGISLRQVLDWVMHLSARNSNINHAELGRTIAALHLRVLYDLFSAFAQEYLGAPAEIFETAGIPGATDAPAPHPATGELWSIIRRSGNFGCIGPYAGKHFRSHVHERLYRTRFLLGQAREIKNLDSEFGRYLTRREIRGFFASIGRAFTGRNTATTE